MSFSMRGWPFLFLSLILFGPGGNAGAATGQFASIGTGGMTGVYYPTGGAICKLVNRNRRVHGIRCNVEATGGSVSNVNTLEAGEMDFGIVQSDVSYKAWKGEKPFPQKMEKLRSLFSLHTENLTLVVRKDSGIKSLKDLPGKRVNIGNPGSGQERTVRELFSACKMKEDSLALVGRLKAAEMPDALRDRKLDGYFYVVGHPTSNIKDVATRTDIALIEIKGDCVDRLVAERPYYVKAVTPGGLYRGVDKDVPTIAVKATFLSSREVNDEVVYQFVKIVFENLEEFKTLHPAYRTLDPERMLEGLSAPMHPGAERYFKEKKLL